MRRLFAMTLLAAALAAMRLDAAALEPVADMPEEAVAAVRVEGNRRVETAAVIRRLETKSGVRATREGIRRDLRTLHTLGYFEDIEVRLLTGTEAGADGPVIVFRVTEKPAVRQVRYEGLDELSEDDLEEIVTVRAFSILDLNKVNATAVAIEEKYREKGYYLANVGYRLDPIEGEAAVDVVFEIEERSKVQVKSIRFVGNEQITDDQIKAVMETREGGHFSFLSGSGTYKEDAFDRDMLRISAVYYDQGYINVKVGQPRVTLTPDRRFIYITVPVEEGQQYRIGELGVAGDLLGDEELVRSRVRMAEGDLFVRTRLGEDIMAVQDLFRDRGYAYVSVTPLTAIDPDERTIDLTLDINQGEKVYVERIELKGHTRTRDKVIRRELRIDEGDLYRGTAIRLSQQRVNALGYFESVDISTRRGSRPDTVILEMAVKERPTGTFQVGAGVSTGEGLLVTAQVAHDNLFGRGQSLSFSWMFSSLRNIFQLQFMEPYFLDTRWTFAFGAHNTRADFFDFVRNSTGGNLTWGYQLVDDLRLFATYTLEDVSVSALDRVAQAVPPSYFEGGITSSAKLALSYDTRDNRLFPTRGQYQTASIEHAPQGPPLFSQNQFTRLSLTSRWYYPVAWGIVARAKGELGYITGDKFPLSERYYLGGVFSLRGYLLRTISPTVEFPSDGDPGAATAPFRTGGDKQALFNFELEFPILTQIGIRGVVFYDMGNAYADTEPWFVDKQENLPLGMFHSMGFGVRWFSPIGPLRFEWGIPLTRRPTDEKIRFEFMVGNAF